MSDDRQADEDIVFGGCLWFAALAWITPILFGLLLGWAILGGLR